jgi:hypothetical protein
VCQRHSSIEREREGDPGEGDRDRERERERERESRYRKGKRDVQPERPIHALLEIVKRQ